MEKMHTDQAQENIPDKEQADMEVSPVTQEEMDAAVAAISETNERDERRIGELKQEIAAMSPQEEVPPAPPATPRETLDGRNPQHWGMESTTRYRRCELCRGSGKRLLILKCPACGGMGSVPVSKETRTWGAVGGK